MTEITHSLPTPGRVLCEGVLELARGFAHPEAKGVPQTMQIVAEGFIGAHKQLLAIEQFALIKQGNAGSPGRKRDWGQVIAAARIILGAPEG